MLQILAGMVVLIWHLYRSSAGDGSLVLMVVAQSAKGELQVGTAVLCALECMLH